MTGEAVARLMAGLYLKDATGSVALTEKTAMAIVSRVYAQWHVPVRLPTVDEWRHLFIKYASTDEYRVLVEAFKIYEETVV